MFWNSLSENVVVVDEAEGYAFPLHVSHIIENGVNVNIIYVKTILEVDIAYESLHIREQDEVVVYNSYTNSVITDKESLWYVYN